MRMSRSGADRGDSRYQVAASREIVGITVPRDRCALGGDGIGIGCQPIARKARHDSVLPKSLPALGIPQGEQSVCWIREAFLPALDVQ